MRFQLLGQCFLVWLCIAVTGSLHAQEYWIPSMPLAAANTPLPEPRLMEGQNLTGKPSALTLIGFWFAGTKTEVPSSWPTGFTGSRVYGIAGTPWIQDLTPEEFNRLVKTYDLDTRISSGTRTTPLRLNRKIFASTLINRVAVTRDPGPAGLEFEVVPLDNPLMLAPEAQMKFRVMFRGKPVFGVQVKFRNITGNLTTGQTLYTDAAGIVETPLSAPGKWLVQAAYLEESADHTQATGYWTTFSFQL